MKKNIINGILVAAAAILLNTLPAGAVFDEKNLAQTLSVLRFDNFISLTLTAYLPEVDALYVKLGYYNWLTGAASVIVGLFLLACLFYLFYRAGVKRKKGLVSNVYQEDGFTIVATSNVTEQKENAFKGLARFLKSLFSKQGWKKIRYELEESNGVEYIGKNQNLTGVWIALALVCAYWLYGFIAGLI